MAPKPQYEYRLCEVRDRKGDLAKRWYVEFWVWDVGTDSLIRKVDYISSKIKTKAGRYSRAEEIKREIDHALINGAFIDSSGKTKRQPREKVLTISQAFDFFVKTHSPEVGDRAKDSYRSFFNVYDEFLHNRKYAHLPIGKISQEIIYEFLDYLQSERKVSNRTRNNYLIWLNTVFNYLIDREILKESPTKKIKKLKTKAATHVPYDDALALKIKNHLRSNDPQMFLFCAFIYYTLARPKEIQLLKVRDIKGNKLLFSSVVKYEGKEVSLSKNQKSQYVTLPKGLRALIEEFGILEHNPDYFIFGNIGEPGPQPYSKHYSTKKYKPVLEALDVTGGQTLYSWKHTGAIKLYRATKDMKKVQRQCRHWSITETDNYLRDLGMFEDDEVEFNFPDF